MTSSHDDQTEAGRRFEARVGRLEAALARAVQVARTLRLARQPDGEPQSRLDGLRRKIADPRQVAVRTSELRTPVAPPPEAGRWIAGLRRAYDTLSAASEERVPDKRLLLAQLGRTVDRLAADVNQATAPLLSRLGDMANRATGRVHLPPEAVEELESKLRSRVDTAIDRATPGEPATYDRGIFTGFVEASLHPQPAETPQPEAMVQPVGAPCFDQAADAPRIAEDVEQVPEPRDVGELPEDSRSGLSHISAPAPDAGAPVKSPSDWGVITPGELEELKPIERGAIKKFDPARFAVSGPGGETFEVEVLDKPQWAVTSIGPSDAAEIVDGEITEEGSRAGLDRSASATGRDMPAAVPDDPAAWPSGLGAPASQRDAEAVDARELGEPEPPEPPAPWLSL